MLLFPNVLTKSVKAQEGQKGRAVIKTGKQGVKRLAAPQARSNTALCGPARTSQINKCLSSSPHTQKNTPEHRAGMCSRAPDHFSLNMTHWMACPSFSHHRQCYLLQGKKKEEKQKLSMLGCVDLYHFQIILFIFRPYKHVVCKHRNLILEKLPHSLEPQRPPC